MITPELIHKGNKSKEQYLLTKFQEFDEYYNANRIFLRADIKERFAQIQERQAELQQKFSENALDALYSISFK